MQGDVRFENVTFRYFNSGDPVLKNVSFEASPGQDGRAAGRNRLAARPPSSTCCRASTIPRDGRITIDGHDLRDVTLNSLRSQIGIVLQETTLFAGTIRDNIAFGKPDATLDEVIAAAKAAAAHDFIMSFPQGYDTPVGERGTTLSGGQKQRIAIARALLLDPHILILDDSTSCVDLATEAHIQKALDRLMKKRGPHQLRDRPAHQHGDERRPDPGAGQGRDRGARHACRADGRERDLRRDLQLAARGRRRGCARITRRSRRGERPSAPTER